ncbi:era-like GTP-binding protein [Lactarius sanguifluus]|nr:era-like GTP-binding protein [Lactarius sanguifluus]
MSDVSNQVLASFEAREKYRYFRILVIGRANAGKTTLLKRVCNTTDEPCIYDEKSNSLLEPTSERGIHDIDRPFAFTSNPQFIFHDSPGFETGDESQLKKVQSFIEKRARSTEVDHQLHAIWFCFKPDESRFLLDLEMRFFNEQRAGNIPVIAIFAKFDDLISQVYDIGLDEDENRVAAETFLTDKLRKPLFEYTFPPRADVRLEDMHKDDGNHQEQVKSLIKKTAESLDDLALKILFVSLQQNNLELCVEYAIKYAPDHMERVSMMELVQRGLEWFRHSYFEVSTIDNRESG